MYQNLCKLRIPGEARQVLDFILWKKDECITLKDISLATGLKKSNVVRGLNTLLSIRIVIKSDNAVIKTDNGIGNKWLVQDNPNFWKPLSKTITQRGFPSLPLIKKKEKSPTPPIKKKEINPNPTLPQTVTYVTAASPRKTGDDCKKSSISDSLVAPPVPVTPPRYGRKEINDMLAALRMKIGITAFVDSSIERFMGKNCLSLFGKLGKEEFVRRLNYLLSDPFHQKNCNKIKYVYNNIKGFIEPKTQERKTVFIS